MLSAAPINPDAPSSIAFTAAGLVPRGSPRSPASARYPTRRASAPNALRLAEYPKASINPRYKTSSASNAPNSSPNPLLFAKNRASPAASSAAIIPSASRGNPTPGNSGNASPGAPSSLAATDSSAAIGASIPDCNRVTRLPFGEKTTCSATPL